MHSQKSFLRFFCDAGVPVTPSGHTVALESLCFKQMENKTIDAIKHIVQMLNEDKSLILGMNGKERKVEIFRFLSACQMSPFLYIQV